MSCVLHEDIPQPGLTALSSWLSVLGRSPIVTNGLIRPWALCFCVTAPDWMPLKHSCSIFALSEG